MKNVVKSRHKTKTTLLILWILYMYGMTSFFPRDILVWSSLNVVVRYSTKLCMAVETIEPFSPWKVMHVVFLLLMYKRIYMCDCNDGKYLKQIVWPTRLNVLSIKAALSNFFVITASNNCPYKTIILLINFLKIIMGFLLFTPA